MNPPIRRAVIASARVKELLGDPPRFEPFGPASHASARPYATWQWVGGAPQNYLGAVPDIDSALVQVDIYAETDVVLMAVVHAVRDAIEPYCHITSWRGQSVDWETKLLRFSFDCEWWVAR